MNVRRARVDHSVEYYVQVRENELPTQPALDNAYYATEAAGQYGVLQLELHAETGVSWPNTTHRQQVTEHQPSIQFQCLLQHQRSVWTFSVWRNW
jgi:hypothetical protein